MPIALAGTVALSSCGFITAARDPWKFAQNKADDVAPGKLRVLDAHRVTDAEKAQRLIPDFYGVRAIYAGAEDPDLGIDTVQPSILDKTYAETVWATEELHRLQDALGGADQVLALSWQIDSNPYATITAWIRSDTTDLIAECRRLDHGPVVSYLPDLRIPTGPAKYGRSQTDKTTFDGFALILNLVSARGADAVGPVPTELPRLLALSDKSRISAVKEVAKYETMLEWPWPADQPHTVWNHLTPADWLSGPGLRIESVPALKAARTWLKTQHPDLVLEDGSAVARRLDGRPDRMRLYYPTRAEAGQAGWGDDVLAASVSLDGTRPGEFALVTRSGDHEVLEPERLPI